MPFREEAPDAIEGRVTRNAGIDDLYIDVAPFDEGSFRRRTLAEAVAALKTDEPPYTRMRVVCLGFSHAKSVPR